MKTQVLNAAAQVCRVVRDVENYPDLRSLRDAFDDVIRKLQSPAREAVAEFGSKFEHKYRKTPGQTQGAAYAHALLAQPYKADGNFAVLCAAWVFGNVFDEHYHDDAILKVLKIGVEDLTRRVLDYEPPFSF